MCEKQTLVALTGPTAVGKTALSLALAKALDGEIISADSMQVYRHMDIGTAKITAAEMQGVPHHLIDILEPEENFDAMRFQKLAKQAIEEIQARGKVPILVGGTGFYLQTVLYEVPFSEESRDEAVHAALTERRAREGIASLYAELSAVDPDAAAQIHPNNEKRVLRALEYFLSSGERISRHNAEARERQSPYALSYFVLSMERQSLYRRIDARVEAMFRAGLVEEVRSLA
ncbi:MAG: tRNA (adenosine(37)-N6)-dimethylallyltransferase MiaA, partial [Stomatobaculum longum]|nr:tRNA (adenosine(37)-N6)-dimethylallyltransferase MiaA [Stomatobaculum longum]